MSSNLPPKAAPASRGPQSARTGIVAPQQAARAGVLFGVAAYGFWGLAPIYFKAIAHVPTLEILAHRVIWSVVFLLLLMLLGRNTHDLRSVLRSRRTLGTLCVTTLLIAGNWLGFIWAVQTGQVMQASLGYFINPLLNVLLGFIFLRERLRRWQSFSVLLAGVGVAYLTIAGGQFPALALFLAGSFGFYGLLRKTASARAVVGLTVETTLLLPLSLGFLAVQMARGAATFGTASIGADLLLMAAGLVTAVPLLWFAAAARRLRLATLGFLQYLAPTGHFLLALAYGESFSRAHLIAFVFIWTALAIYSIDAAARARAAPAADATPSME